MHRVRVADSETLRLSCGSGLSVWECVFLAIRRSRSAMRTAGTSDWLAPHVPAFSARICRRGHAGGRAEQDDRDCPRRGLCRAAATRSPGEQFDVFTRPHSDIKTPILGISDRYLWRVS